MNKEQLLSLGLSEEQADAVVKGIEESGSVPYARFKEVNDAKKALESQVNEFSNQLKTLQGSVKGNEELENQIKELQKAQSETKAQYEQMLKDSKVDAAIKLALVGKAHDEDLVLGLIDRGSIEVDDNYKVVKGLDEQLTSLQESKSFLFKTVEPTEPQQPTLSGVKPGNLDAPPVPGTSVGAQIAQQLNGVKQTTIKSPWG